MQGGEICGDLLEEEILRHSKASEQVVITASLLFASVFGEKNWSEGYRWIHSQLKGNYESLARLIKTEQEVKHLKSKYFYSAIKLLEVLEKKI